MTVHEKRKFAKTLKNRLLKIGLELVKHEIDWVMIFKHIDEEIIVPLMDLEFMSIYFVKNNKVTEVFRCADHAAGNTTFIQFYLYFKERNYKKILSSDDSTQLYI